MKTSDLPLLVCVDDESEVLDSLHRIFRLEFRVMPFTDPKKALKFISDYKKEIPIIISDFKMGPINGLDFLKTVKLKAPTSYRIILSGQIEIQHLSDSINEQVIHKFFMKPWDNELLKIQIKEVLQTRELMLEKEKYKHLSITDPVTLLTNHRFFQENLTKELALSNESSPVSLLMIDVDHFKKYNDAHGHPAGDKLLQNIAGRIKDGLMNIPCSVSRYGGEEFSVILPFANKEEALKLAESIRHSFETIPFVGENGSSSSITISCGVATAPADTTDKAELINLADKALYRAKNEGRNKVCA